MIVSTAIQKMIEFYKGNRHDVNHFLKVWSMADASYIRWESQDACLLSCHDITPYKE